MAIIYILHDIYVSKQNELENECHTSIGPRKWKKNVEFSENVPRFSQNSTNIDIIETV